ncbi:MAG: hypothetical protein PHX21_04600 [bacterium]|nr:hypothetical protein [bacterium]
MIILLNLLICSSSETALRMPMFDMTIPANIVTLSNTVDFYEDFFMSYPLLNDNFLILCDGIPISRDKIPISPSIEKIEVINENVSSTYGNYACLPEGTKGVINIITKRFKPERPYSNIKWAKSPDYFQFELGRPLFRPNITMYVAGNLDTTLKTTSNLCFNSSLVNLQAFYRDNNTFGISASGGKANRSKLILTRDFYSLTQRFNISEHQLLIGVEDENGYFVQDYWEPFRLLYLVPSVRYGYDSKFYPKLGLGYVPVFNVTLFGSVTEKEQNAGIRVLESSINYSTVNGLTTRLVSPSLYNLKIGAFFGKDSLEGFTRWTLWGEYGKYFPSKEIGIHITGDIMSQMVRLELQIIDVKISYRVTPYNYPYNYYSYNIFWEFWD